MKQLEERFDKDINLFIDASKTYIDFFEFLGKVQENPKIANLNKEIPSLFKKYSLLPKIHNLYSVQSYPVNEDYPVKEIIIDSRFIPFMNDFKKHMTDFDKKTAFLNKYNFLTKIAYLSEDFNSFFNRLDTISLSKNFPERTSAKNNLIEDIITSFENYHDLAVKYTKPEFSNKKKLNVSEVNLLDNQSDKIKDHINNVNNYKDFSRSFIKSYYFDLTHNINDNFLFLFQHDFFKHKFNDFIIPFKKRIDIEKFITPKNTIISQLSFIKNISYVTDKFKDAFVKRELIMKEWIDQEKSCNKTKKSVVKMVFPNDLLYQMKLDPLRLEKNRDNSRSKYASTHWVIDPKQDSCDRVLNLTKILQKHFG